MNHNRLTTYVLSEAVCSRFSFGIIGFALPLYAMHIGMNESSIGLLMAMHFGFEVGFKPFLGRLSDKFGRKAVLCAALALRSVVALSLGFISTVFGLFMIRALHGVSESVREPTMSAFLIETNAKKVMSAFARYNSIRMLSGAAGKAAAGYLLMATSRNYSLLFIIAFVISAGSILAVCMMRSEPVSTGLAKEQAPLQVACQSDATMRNTQRSVYLYGYMCGISASILNLLFPVLAVKYGGLTEAEVGTIYLIGGLAVMVFTLLIERLDGWASDTSFLSMRAASTVVSTALYGIGGGMFFFAMGAATDEGGKLAFKAGWGSLLAKASENRPEQRAAIASRFGIVENLAEISGPILGGWLLSAGGPVLLLTIRAGVSILGEAILYISSKKR